MPRTMCPDCFRGTLRGDVVPQGTEETIHGLRTYVARPDGNAKPLGLIIIIPDAFGWEFLNMRALADVYARRGPFLVYIPDFMNGHAISVNHLYYSDRLDKPAPTWSTALLKPYWAFRAAASLAPFGLFVQLGLGGAVKPRVLDFFRAVRSSAPPPELQPAAGDEERAVRIGVAGFCWGGRWCFEVAKDPTLADCAFAAHPALLSIPDDVEAVAVPLSVANGEDDEWMGSEKFGVLTRVLEGKEGGGHEVVVYPGARHGFAVRQQPGNQEQIEFGLRAEDQAVEWFQRRFAS